LPLVAPNDPSDRPHRHRRSPRHRHEIRRDRLHDNTWLIPGLFGIAALLMGIGVARWPALQNLAGDVGYRGDLDNAKIVLSTIAAAMLTFMAVVFSATLVALQLASGQFSPRVLRTFQRDRRTQVVQGIFLATFVYSLTALAELGRADNRGIPFEVLVALLLVAASLAAFILYVHHISRSIRAVYVMEAIAVEAYRALDQVFPVDPEPPPDSSGFAPHEDGRGQDGRGENARGEAGPENGRSVIVVPSPRSGVVAAVDLYQLADRAESDDLYVTIVPPVGAYVALGQPLFEVSVPLWSSQVGPAELTRLSRAVDLTESRTMYQDVGFALRQLVDIAERALSPAVNDPTTAVQALDRIGDLVRRIAARPTPDGLTTGAGGAQARVRHQVPSWEAVVELAFEEIRWFGRECIQISRRLLAIFDDLEQLVADTGRPERADAVRRQRGLLVAAVLESYPNELQEAALQPDAMGLGSRA
jgi:uncharacterized membrane protein